MNGLITRLFCAERLSILMNHGCCFELLFGLEIAAVFIWLRLLHLYGHKNSFPFIPLPFLRRRG